MTPKYDSRLSQRCYWAFGPRGIGCYVLGWAVPDVVEGRSSFFFFWDPSKRRKSLTQRQCHIPQDPNPSTIPIYNTVSSVLSMFFLHRSIMLEMFRTKPTILFRFYSNRNSCTRFSFPARQRLSCSDIHTTNSYNKTN
jgi:hypothetical protein